MTVKFLTADERAYMQEKRLKLPDSYDFANDVQFQTWLKDLTNNILDGLFPRVEREVKDDVKDNLEALHYLRTHPTRKLEYGDNCIKLFEPLDEAAFQECRDSITREPNETYVEHDSNDLYANIYLYNITDLKEIFTLIDKIYETQPKPFKIAFDCGFIVEDTVEHTYTNSNPSVANLGKTVPMTIVGPSDVQLYKHLVFSTLGDYTSEVHAVSAGSRFHYCAIHTIMFQVTHMKRNGARFLVPGYDFLIKNKYIKDYGNDYNLCMFYVMANSNK